MLAGLFALATLISVFALASISGIGAGLIIFVATQLTISPLAFTTLTTIIGLGLTALTTAFAVYFHKELKQTHQHKKDNPKVVYMSRPQQTDTPHYEWAAKRNQMKELLSRSEGRPIYVNIPKGLQSPEEYSSEDQTSELHP